ncbi:hypothetical protein, conserved [Leishmania tarentolae]|uniref:Uncharacterized protein n=1 Tax=Leishmania tarentolae TaxID=5689 RepID=A0A640KA14_LEITA|nr:hypothetical protein, conserved [Leishmania tarentolae]
MTLRGGGGSGPATSSLSPMDPPLNVAAPSLTALASLPVPAMASATGTTGGAGFPLAAATPSTSSLSSSNTLDLMRTYHAYVRMHKAQYRYLVLLLLMLLYYFQLTFCGRYGLMSAPREDTYRSLGGGVAGSGAVGPSVDSGLRPSLATPDAEAAGDDSTLAGSANSTSHGYMRPPLITRALSGAAATRVRMDLWEVQWWSPSSWTPDTNDARYEQGWHVATPNPASLSLARSEPPWSANMQGGFVSTITRGATRLFSPLFGQAPPPYELALSAFFRTRQAMSAGSCHRCQTSVVNNDVQKELINYNAFARNFKLRVPLLLYYNRMPVYAMMQHLRLMRVQTYRLLDYMSRNHSSQSQPETATGDIAVSPDLRARQLKFELSRLSLVFYLQRLHLRALRHADAMRLETLHFLRYLSSTIPVLRSIWVGQDHCRWKGVSCVVVRVPLNSLIDSEHPAVQAFVDDLLSICRGPQCRQRRCAPPSCSAYTRHLMSSLFTSAAPAYWLKWDRTDDTAAMDEMMWEKAPTSSQGAAGINVATASPSSPSITSAAAAATAGRASRGTSAKSKRSVWTEQMFAYEHPHLVLTEPLLLVDIDVQGILREVLEPITPSAPINDDDECVSSASSSSATVLDPPADFATPADTEDVEQTLAGDLLDMQRRLLRTIAEAAPRGLRYGKQRNDSSTVTIPYVFVKLNLASMGLSGYLPDFYDIASAYDEQNGAADATGKRESSDDDTVSASSAQSHFADACEEVNPPSATATEPRKCGRTSAAETSVFTPRSERYWGRRSRMRMLNARDLTSASHSKAATRRPLVPLAALESDLQQVLRRLETIGQRNHHEDLAAYFSEVASLALYQNERWSPYSWSEAMRNITTNVASSARQRLYSILEESAFSPSFVDPVPNIDHHVNAFGELNPRLIGLLSLDVSANPSLTHLFPQAWLSIPYLQSVRTTGTSILTPPLQVHIQVYNRTAHCPASSMESCSDLKADAERAMGYQRRKDTESAAKTETVRDKIHVLSPPWSSFYDNDVIGGIFIPPFPRIDTLFATRSPSDTIL